MSKFTRHRRVSTDAIGQVRVWMDAHGVDMVIIGRAIGTVVITAAHATECDDGAVTLAVARLRWREGRTIALHGISPIEASQIESEAHRAGVRVSHLSEDTDGRFRL